MNPMTNVKNIKKLSEQELKRGTFKSSWHDQYKGSAWLFVGGLPYDLTEGDIICVFSQYGEVVNINLVRDKGTGKSKGFCFLCYEDQRSTVLAVDNFNGIKLLGRTIRVDHVADYKAPKDSDKLHDETRKLHAEGCAPKPVAESMEKDTDVVILKDVKKEKKEKAAKVKVKKEKKHKKKKKKKQVKMEESSSSSSSSSSSESNSGSDDDSDSNSKNSKNSKKTVKRGKAKHSTKKHKKRSRSSDSVSSSQDEVIESAKSKRKLLEEKIKELEQALNSVKNSSRKNLSNPDNQATISKSRNSVAKSEPHEHEKPSTSSEHQNKRRYDNENHDSSSGGRRRDYNSHSSSDHQDRSSSRNENYRNRDSGRRRGGGGGGEENGIIRDQERSRERERYEDRNRERYRERDNRDYERERERYRDRSRDRYRR